MKIYFQSVYVRQFAGKPMSGSEMSEYSDNSALMRIFHFDWGRIRCNSQLHIDNVVKSVVCGSGFCMATQAYRSARADALLKL